MVRVVEEVSIGQHKEVTEVKGGGRIRPGHGCRVEGYLGTRPITCPVGVPQQGTEEGQVLEHCKATLLQWNTVMLLKDYTDRLLL